MFWQIPRSLHRWIPQMKPKRSSSKTSSHFVRDSLDSKGSPYLPPSPRELLSNRVFYEMPLLYRKVDHENDTPLAALYRLYEHIVLDQNIEMRNEIEAFWFNNTWAVRDIPDPHDPNRERYACLACIPALLCLAFKVSRRPELGRHYLPQQLSNHSRISRWPFPQSVWFCVDGAVRYMGLSISPHPRRVDGQRPCRHRRPTHSRSS